MDGGESSNADLPLVRFESGHPVKPYRKRDPKKRLNCFCRWTSQEQGRFGRAQWPVMAPILGAPPRPAPPPALSTL